MLIQAGPSGRRGADLVAGDMSTATGASSSALLRLLMFYFCSSTARAIAARRARPDQAACKPGSVRGAAGAAGWPFLWDACRQAPRATDPDDRPGNRPAPRRAGPSSLLGLAPGGVCRAAAVAGDAVRSYRTLSPSTRRPASPRPRRADCSLWHFPWGRPRRALPGTVFPWSPDFPPPRSPRERPSGRLIRPRCRVGRRAGSSARSEQRQQAVEAGERRRVGRAVDPLAAGNGAGRRRSRSASRGRAGRGAAPA